MSKSAQFSLREGKCRQALINKQLELAKIVSLIEEVVPAMIILFGSYARNEWQAKELKKIGELICQQKIAGF